MLSVKHFSTMSICILLLSISAVAEETGSLQITCKTGIRIFLDDRVAGVTAEQDGGLLVHGISPGIHKVRGENAEFIPPEFGVSIRAGETTEIKIDKGGAPMVLIPAGHFRMGGKRGAEYPVHSVYIDAFYMDNYPVTNAQYRRFAEATGHREPEGFRKVSGGWRSDFRPWSDGKFNGDDQPVVCISWHDAKAYAEWAGKRLSTEAEWERAARGGLTGKEYPPGEELTHDDANYYGISGKDMWESTSPVGSFAPNGFGLYDMAGNVCEWCADWYSYYYYLSSPRRNPKGPSSGNSRVLRGGSWFDFDHDLRCAYRYLSLPTYTVSRIGFRCASDVNP